MTRRFAAITAALLAAVALATCGVVGRISDGHLDIEQAELQLTREPLPAPVMTIAPRDDLFAYRLEDFALEDSEPWPHIKAPVAV